MGRQREIYCKICMKTMRGDNLQRHMKQHEKKSEKEKYKESMTIEGTEIAQEERSFNVATNKDVNTRLEDEDLRKILEKCSKEYDEKINLGGRIYRILGENKIKQESIPPLYKEALDLFVKQKQSIDQQNVTLRPWQEELRTEIENPSYREVLWVKGINGCEGKSWFQNYIESKYGWNKVVSGMDIKAKNSSICHALGKRPLTTTDVFLFNVGKANTMDDVNYEVLEKIKDGKLLASKYDSKELRIRTPNIVIVFSNGDPNIKELALDRWRLFSIIDNELIDITEDKLTPKGKMTTTNGEGCITEYFY